MLDQGARIAIAGAGSIGCYVGGCLALAGRDVTFLARPRIETALRAHGLRVSDLDGGDRQLGATRLAQTTAPATAFGDADVILVTVKSGGSEDMARLIAAHAPEGAKIVSLQNGIDNAGRIAAVAGRPVVAGM